jgi:hypothetical protein
MQLLLRKPLLIQYIVVREPVTSDSFAKFSFNPVKSDSCYSSRHIPPFLLERIYYARCRHTYARRFVKKLNN